MDGWTAKMMDKEGARDDVERVAVIRMCLLLFCQSITEDDVQRNRPAMCVVPRNAGLLMGNSWEEQTRPDDPINSQPWPDVPIIIGFGIGPMSRTVCR